MKYLIKLAIKSIRYRKSVLLLSMISVAMSVILLLGVERIRSNIHESFTSTISGTDLIVGARSGNIPLLLSTVFHIGYPNQNVSWQTYKNITSLPQVAWTIPLSLGDSHKGFSVLGTNTAFFEHFRYGQNQLIKTSQGKPDIKDKKCVLGSKVAKELGYQTGEKLVVTHGVGDKEFIKHEDEPFVVAATLKATGTPVDQTIFVSLYALDEIHAKFYGDESHDYDVFADVMDKHHHHSRNHAVEPEAITGFLIGLKNRNDILAVHRRLNDFKAEPITAIMPVVTLLELWEIVHPIEKTLMIISGLVLIVALGGILTTLMTSLNDRRREMAILRSVGAKPKHIFGLIIFETLGIILSGIITGVLITQLVLYLSKPIIAEKWGLVIKFGWFSVNELILLTTIFILGGLIGLFPAYRLYKTSLTDGLMINK